MLRYVCAVFTVVAVSCATVPRDTTVERRPSPAERGDERPYLLYIEAMTLESEGELRMAGERYRMAHALDPTAYEPAEGYARYLARLGECETAVAVMDSVGSWTDEGRRLVGDCLRFIGQPERAAHEYETVLGSAPDDGGLWARLYLAYTSMGRDRDANGAMKRVASLAGGEAEAWLLLGRIHNAEGRRAEARRAFEKAAGIAPNDPRPWVSLGAASLVDGDVEQALVDYRAGLSHLPGDTAITDRLVALLIDIDSLSTAADAAESALSHHPDDLERRRRLAILQMSVERFERSEANLTVYVDSGGTDPGALLFLGRARLMLERPDAQVNDAFDRFLAADSSAEAWNMVGTSFIAADRLAEAVGRLESAVSRYPESVDLHSLLGTAHIRAQEYDEAAVALMRAVELDSTDRAARFNLASVYERVGRFDEAIALFESLLAQDPDDASTLNYLGYMLADAGVRLFEAQTYIERALEVEPDNYAYVDSYGWVLFRQDFFERAVFSFERAVELLEESGEIVQDDAVIYDHLGDTYSRLGRDEDARLMWRKALELDPDNEEIKHKVER